ncbi:MAG: thiamine-monophosphate kinase [Gemmatimonadota bacterium]
MALGPGAEFDLIRAVLSGAPEPGPDVLLGPGDDAAVVGDGWVLSTDLSVEDVHFRRRWMSDHEVGFRATAAALSDLAAMAAEPVGVLVSLALPAGGSVDAVGLNRGVQEAAALVGATVLGGDVSRSPGPVFIDVTVVGRARHAALRSGARPGDEVWVTGALGGAAAALLRWQEGAEPPPDLRDAFVRPTPRIAAARGLAAAGVVRAMVDVSDGLAGDAGHLAAAGGVKVVLVAASVPVAVGVAEGVGAARALEAALHGGEDYELCFVAPPGSVDREALSATAGVPLTRVGRVEEGAGVWLEGPDGSVVPLARGGYDHLAGGRP